MVKRRAVSREDKELQPSRLPTLYKTLSPLFGERHGNLFLSDTRNYDFAKTANAIPITIDEFPQAMRNYPIVLAGFDNPTPVALVGFKTGENDFVGKDGAWTKGAYIPAYLRRYPFAFIRESEEAERNILCADLSYVGFETKGAAERALFDDAGEPTQMLNNVMDFCNRYDQAVQRTQVVMQEAKKFDLVDSSTVTISRKGQNLKVQGFNIVSEEKLRKLEDADLAGLARRGILTLFTAHHLSMTNFSGFGDA